MKLTFRCFCPGLKSEDKENGIRTYESLDRLWCREVIPFANYNSHAKIINVETIAYNLYTDGLSMLNIKRKCFKKLLHVRVYFDGPVADPPPGFITPPPIWINENENDSCHIL